ncbi:hypothetical protein D0T11_17655 [Hymenobacter rubripertinctus]|uniref:Uncharacterized protein n=2 Tax=Hymenobacter rubripertinctus TaxID=2029981 RepID=A0A418QNU5_9BACT|nr:hypothetical protein D0T11_17655 [Hymenobacter rubripertinctus]
MGSIHYKMMSYWDEIDLIRVPQWTEKEGSRMAFARYRNTYLPSHLAAKIKEEEYNPLKVINVEIRTAFNSEEFDKRKEIQRLIDEEEGNNHLPF